MQSCWLVQICIQIHFLSSKIVHESLKFAYEFFLLFSRIRTQIRARIIRTNSYANSQVDFVHEIGAKFVIFDKLGKISYEFASIREGYVTNGLYCI